jgi:HEAT repeat protein
LACAVLLGLPPVWAGKADGLREAQAAFEQRRYDRVLSLTEPFTTEGLPEVLRLRVRTLLKLDRPADALTEYERLAAKLGKEDPRLLRDVAVGFITPVLKDMREQMRGAAYTALKDLQADETVPFLEDGLGDGSGLVRALAAEGLGRLKSGQRSARLQKALEDQAAIVRVAVLKALGRSGNRSVIPVVERMLNDEQPVVRVAASGALVMLGRAEAWNRLREAAEASNPEERGAALRMLGELRDRRALPILQQALNDAQPSVRGAAVAALGELGALEAVPALINALNDPIPAVRTTAAVGLGELASLDAIPPLKKALADANPAARAAAVSGLFRLGVPYSEIASVIRELSRNVDPGIRASAARALARSRREDEKDATEMLRQLLDDPLPRPRIAAARSLGQIGGDATVPILKRALGDKDEAVRATAGGALGRMLVPPAAAENRENRLRKQ